MYRLANTQAIREGAHRFAMAADEMRQGAIRMGTTVVTLVEGSRKWEGDGADAFHAVAEHLQEDARTVGFAFEQTASILQSLANQLEQVNQLRQQAAQLEQEMYSLENSLWGADDEQRASIQHHLSQVRYQHSSVVYEADSKEYQANQSASASFHGVTAMIHRLHVYDSLQATSKPDEPSLLDRVGHFFSNLWGSTVHEVDDAKKDGGVLGGIVGFAEGLKNSLADLLETGWKMTPEYPIYELMFHPDEFKKEVTSKIYEYTHPIETVKNLHPIEEAKVLFNSVKTSFEDDIIHGNAYTRAKWVGYAAGVVGSAILTDGETAAARGATAVEEVSETATTLEATAAKEVGSLEAREVIAPSSGKAIRVYTDGSTIIPIDKIEKYMRGRVNVDIQEVNKELRELKRLKQTQRKVFDADPQNAERIKKLESMKHNFERSDDMRNKLESIGLGDTAENNELIAQHLLEVGKQITSENRLDFPSILEGTNGKVKVLTTWSIVDGKPYLATIKIIPIKS